MSSQRKLAGRILAILLSLTILAACNGQGGEPTPDANAIFTAAAETVGAQLSQTAAAKPADTSTPQPTNTIVPTSTVGTITLPALPGPGSVLPSLSPLPGLATATRQVVSTGDKCEWQRNDPADGVVIDPKVGFDLVYSLKNAGTSTWNTNYKLRYYVGDYFTDAREFNLKETVAPGQIGRAIADATAPSTKGTYKATFVLTNDQGVNFCVLDFTFSVGSSIAATQGGNTSTPDTLEWMCSASERAAIQGRGCRTHCSTASGTCYYRTGVNEDGPVGVWDPGLGPSNP